VIFRPKPVSRIPVILGAPVGGIKALDRIARRADGWMSAAIPLPAMTGAWQRIQETAAGHGRDAAAMKLICRGNITFTDAPAGKDRYPFVGTKDQIVEDVVACAEAGVDEVVIDVFLQDPISRTSGKWSTRRWRSTSVPSRQGSEPAVIAGKGAAMRAAYVPGYLAAFFAERKTRIM
jgi:alkanesulfonate monooxygenase SsuD/methylene tetrahydromethanopterin reductase-like flavin-dependent oxidoreductase (luciferase family)